MDTNEDTYIFSLYDINNNLPYNKKIKTLETVNKLYLVSIVNDMCSTLNKIPSIFDEYTKTIQQGTESLFEKDSTFEDSFGIPDENQPNDNRYKLYTFLNNYKDEGINVSTDIELRKALFGDDDKQISRNNVDFYIYGLDYIKTLRHPTNTSISQDYDSSVTASSANESNGGNGGNGDNICKDNDIKTGGVNVNSKICANTGLFNKPLYKLLFTNNYKDFFNILKGLYN